MLSPRHIANVDGVNLRGKTIDVPRMNYTHSLPTNSEYRTIVAHSWQPCGRQCGLFRSTLYPGLLIVPRYRNFFLEVPPRSCLSLHSEINTARHEQFKEEVLRL